MVLLDLMTEIMGKDQLVVAHFNHKTRNGESDLDANFVQDYLSERKISFEIGERQGSDLSENGLRKERREFLEKVRLRHQCDYIVLAHHLQDQLETFLMRVIRGTGLDGLAVMEPKQGVWIRPLLKYSKEKLGQEAKERGVSYRLDSSNLLPTNFRNEIRLNLLPLMEALALRYGGKEKWLQRLAPLFGEIQWTKKEINKKITKKIKASLTQTPYWIRIPADEFLVLPTVARKKTLRMIVSLLGVETLSMQELNRLDVALKSLKKNFSGPGIEFGVSCGFIYFRKYSKIKPSIELTYQEKESRVVCDSLGMKIKFKGDGSDLEWRQVQPGDRYRGKKVKEYLLKKRVPKWERALIPVLAKKQSSIIEWIYPEPHPSIEVEQLSFPFVVRD